MLLHEPLQQCRGEEAICVRLMPQVRAWLLPQLDAPEADILEGIDRAVSENYDNQASGKWHTSNPPAGLTSLPEFIKWIAQCCTNPHYVRCLYGCQDIVHEVLHEAQGNGQRIMSNAEIQSS